MNQAIIPLFGRIAAGDRGRDARTRYREILAFVVVACFAAWILIAFHDRFWHPPDEGAYAHVADRLLAGEVLNRDIEDVHAGYVNFANAAAFALFGTKLVSLRYPLAVLTFIQVCLIFFLLLPRGALVAAAGASAMAALTFVQFLNPTAHWYALFLFVAVIAVLTWMPRESRWRLAAVGLLVMTLFLFRQLSGVLVAIGVLTYLLCEAAPGACPARRARDLLLGRAVLAVMGLGLAAYLLVKTDPLTTAMFGLGPLGIIVWAAMHGRLGNREVAAMLLRMSAGGIVALAPLLTYHLVHGSVTNWLDDTVFSAFTLTGLPFFDHARFAGLLLLAVASVVAPTDMAAFVNGVFWLGLILLAPVLSYLTLRGLWRGGRETGARPYLVPVLALFYGLVAVHFQIPIYLMYPAAILLAGLLWIAPAGPGRAGVPVAGFAILLSAVGLYFHAGQPLDRGMSGIVTGVRTPVSAAPGLARAGLRLDFGNAAIYRSLIDLIRREVPPGGSILALPFNPELYFLSRRRNPTRFFNSAIGIRTNEDMYAILESLRRDPPLLVFYRPKDKYVTGHAERIMETVRAGYEKLSPRSGFEIYRYRQD